MSALNPKSASACRGCGRAHDDDATTRTVALAPWVLRRNVRLQWVRKPQHGGSSGGTMSTKSTLYCALTIGCLSAVPASAELLAHKDLSAAMAITIAQTAIEVCKTNGYSVSATVVGRNGEIIVQVRGDNTGPHTIENSFRKAYTARTFRS